MSEIEPIDPLDAVARRLAARPLFFAYAIDVYQRAHNFDDAELCKLLACSQTTLTDLRLCRRPGTADSRTAEEDVLRIAEAFGVDAALLRQIVATAL